MSTAIQPAFDIAAAILTVRGERVLLDGDLARIYGVPTFRFNEAVKRNANRFPDDFRFQLTKEEWETLQRLRSQVAILDPDANLKSQIAISSSGHGGRRKLPWAFTGHGAIMTANVLNSPQAVRNLPSEIGNLKSSEAWRAARTGAAPSANRLPCQIGERRGKQSESEEEMSGRSAIQTPGGTPA